MKKKDLKNFRVQPIVGMNRERARKKQMFFSNRRKEKWQANSAYLEKKRKIFLSVQKKSAIAFLLRDQIQVQIQKNLVDLINKFRAVSRDASRNADRADLLILEARTNVWECYQIGFEIHRYVKWIDSIIPILESELLRINKIDLDSEKKRLKKIQSPADKKDGNEKKRCIKEKEKATLDNL